VLAFELPFDGNQPVTTAVLGGFPCEGVLVGTFTVPPQWEIGDSVGSATVAEYQGPPTSRVATISTSPCDFRGMQSGLPTDDTGADHPIAWGAGNTASAGFVVGPGNDSLPGLEPGSTYYFNVRNYSLDLDGVSCETGTYPEAIVALSPPNN